MTFTKTSQKFGQWSDVRANTVYGLGFSSEAELNKVSSHEWLNVIVAQVCVFTFTSVPVHIKTESSQLGNGIVRKNCPFQGSTVVFRRKS
jgi:hypothetical protein